MALSRNTLADLLELHVTVDGRLVNVILSFVGRTLLAYIKQALSLLVCMIGSAWGRVGGPAISCMLVLHGVSHNMF